MIQKLIIQNIAIIEELSINLEEGLNVISGETGAGKSILVHAINLILGGKIEFDMVRHGATKTSIQIIFHISQDTKKIYNFLEKLSLEKTQEIILRKELFKNGRTHNFINSTLVTNKDLSNLGELLLDISSQHSHQSLIQSKNHLDILDNFAQLTNQKKDFQNYYKSYVDLKKQLNTLLQIEVKKNNELELLQHSIKEIESAKLEEEEEEEEELHKELQYLAHSETLANTTKHIYTTLYQQEHSILTETQAILTKLEQIQNLDSRLSEPYTNIQESIYLLENAKDFLRNYTDKIPHSPHTLETIQNRLELIKKLKRKYGPSISDILTYKLQCEKKVQQFTSNSKKIQELKSNFEQLKTKLLQAANTLSEKRKQKAKEFSEHIEQELKDLAMNNTKFQINFSSLYSSTEYIILNQYKKLFVNENGIDKIEFLFSANPGEPPKPLKKIASGGELSRFILSIKNILTHTDNIETLLFDEVDAGIGGEVLIKVAEKLKRISKKRQVICITHSAQIAGQSDCHHLIEKHEKENRIKTTIKKLTPEESKHEIARMMSGNKLTQTSLQHAQEIINKSREALL